ncbi:MAG: SIS domain-containing protein [Clostridiales bacterium]|nr:SIS domain-containing protein [Clostridiales bacterium]
MEAYHAQMREMYRYFRSQPECMQELLRDRAAIVGGFADFYSRLKPDRVYLIGSGSSLNACRAAKDYMEAMLDVEVMAAEPSNPPIIRGARPLLAVVSQSGKSSNTDAYLRAKHGQGVPSASFTAGIDTPIAHAADLAVDISVGDETVGPKTRGFTGTALCLYLAALEAGRASGSLSAAGYEREIGLLEKTIGCSEENLNTCEAFYRTHLEALKTARRYLFVGKGPAAAVGAEDALKVLETLCFPSAGYEFEEYLHGPAFSTNEETALFLFNPDDADTPRVRRMAAITARASRNSYIIDRTGNLAGEDVLRLRAASSKYMSPFVDVFFGQLLSALLTQEMSITRHEAVHSLTADMEIKVSKEPDEQANGGLPVGRKD